MPISPSQAPFRVWSPLKTIADVIIREKEIAAGK